MLPPCGILTPAETSTNWSKFNVTQLAMPPTTTTTPSAMLRDFEWPTLEQRRQNSRLTMLYKIYNRLPVDCVSVNWDVRPVSTRRWSYIPVYTDAVHWYTRPRGHSSRFLQPQCSCAAYYNSFLPRTIRDWNALAMDPLLFTRT